MKTILLTCSFVVAVSAFCQTPIIAHKSHSGVGATFFIDPNSNFGAIMTTEDMGRRRAVSIPASNPTPNLYIDTMDINDSVAVVNYKTYHQKIVKQETIRVEKKASSKPNTTTKPARQKKQKKLFQQNHPAKHSYLLFLFSFTFGGLFLTRVFK